MNRYRRYSLSALTRLRALQFGKRPRNLEIYPLGRLPVPPAEVVHDHSAVVPSTRPGYVQVLEWSDDGRHELHDVRLTNQ